MAAGVATSATTLWVALLRADLGKETVVVRGLRRHAVAVADVRGIRAGRRWYCGQVVELIPIVGKPVVLRATASIPGRAAFDRDAQVIDRWWSRLPQPAGTGSP